MRQIARAVAWLVLTLANGAFWTGERLYDLGRWLELL